MFLELFVVLSAVVALGIFQYKTEVKRAERIINEIRKEMEQEKENNSNN